MSAKPLNQRQQAALKLFTTTWGKCPYGYRLHISTLLSLVERGALELRPNPEIKVIMLPSNLGYPRSCTSGEGIRSMKRPGGECWRSVVIAKRN